MLVTVAGYFECFEHSERFGHLGYLGRSERFDHSGHFGYFEHFGYFGHFGSSGRFGSSVIVAEDSDWQLAVLEKSFSIGVEVRF